MQHLVTKLSLLKHPETRKISCRMDGLAQSYMQAAFGNMFCLVSQIKGSFSSRSGQGNTNPYSQGSLWKNCAEVLCGPLHPRQNLKSLLICICLILYVFLIFYLGIEAVKLKNYLSLCHPTIPSVLCKLKTCYCSIFRQVFKAGCQMNKKCQNVYSHSSHQLIINFL